MHYWIDGYNLLFALLENLAPTKASFERRREHLITELKNQAEALSLQLTVVFDSSKEENLDTRHYCGYLKIIYTRGKETADELILEAIECSRSPTEICVITADKPLAKKARALKAETKSLEDFLSFLSKKHSQQKQRKSTDFADSPQEITRLLTIFEKKLKETS
jgi:predicted RNA-binding protein with PIN domain